MKISSMKIKNFRGYKDEVNIEFNDLTVFVGKNDVGKSTILEALDIFFNDNSGIIKLDKSDINIKNSRENNKEIIISVCFSELPQNIVIDSSYETSLESEFMLNKDGQLEVIKKYNGTGKQSVFIKANHPTNPDCNDLLTKKIGDLKKILKEKNIDCEDKTVSSKIRKAIWNTYANNLDLQEIELEASKEDAKKIWDKVSTYLPVYSLFQSDRKNSDGDSEIQDPLKEAVKQIFNNSDIQNKLNSIALEVENKLKDVSRRTLEKLREMDSNVANSLNPVIPTGDKLKWYDVFKNVSISDDEDIPINKRGSGVKRLILLNFFRAEAERRLTDGDSTGIIYAIEEPETSQHTNNQKILIDSLNLLSQANNTQVILTTHSAYIVKQLDFNNIRIIYNEDNNKHIVLAKKPVLKFNSLNEVNYIAFDEVSNEYHDELYSFIESNDKLKDFSQNKQTRNYIKIFNDGNKKYCQCILSTYIRHQIHHPENKENIIFTNEELRQSIEEMRLFIKDNMIEVDTSDKAPQTS